MKRSVRPPLTVDRHLLFTVDHAARLVITRQRLGTATGVVFLTLEDETGHTGQPIAQAIARYLAGETRVRA